MHARHVAITSETDFQEIQKFQGITSWKEIYNDPRFVKDHTSQQIQSIGLVEFITRYSDLRPLNPCSLGNCHHKHGTGYILLLKDRTITNIGRDCGSTKFPAIWAEFENIYKTGQSEFDIRLRINELKPKCKALAAQVHSLIARTPTPELLHTQMLNVLASYSPQLQRKLRRRATQKMPSVDRQVKVTSEDDQEIAAITGSKNIHYKSVHIMTISGVSAVNEHGKLLTLPKFKAKIDQVQDLDPESMSFSGLKEWHRFISSIENKITEYEAIYEDCRRFLVPMNQAAINKHWLHI